MLRDVSVDMIKLDMRFLSHEDEGVQSRERNILQAIIPMAKSLGLPIIAEGVETGDQASFLKRSDAISCRGTCMRAPCRRTSTSPWFPMLPAGHSRSARKGSGHGMQSGQPKGNRH